MTVSIRSIENAILDLARRHMITVETIHTYLSCVLPEQGMRDLETLTGVTSWYNSVPLIINGLVTKKSLQWGEGAFKESLGYLENPIRNAEDEMDECILKAVCEHSEMTDGEVRLLLSKTTEMAYLVENTGTTLNHWADRALARLVADQKITMKTVKDDRVFQSYVIIYSRVVEKERIGSTNLCMEVIPPVAEKNPREMLNVYIGEQIQKLAHRNADSIAIDSEIQDTVRNWIEVIKLNNAGDSFEVVKMKDPVEGACPVFLKGLNFIELDLAPFILVMLPIIYI